MPLRSAFSDLEPSPPTGAPPPAAAAAATNDAASDAIIGVYDGHGKHGHLVSNWRQRLAEELRTIPSLDDLAAAERALSEAHRKTNDALKASGIDVTVSGSTACTALKRGRHLHVANVGDSRAVLGRVDEKTGRVVATNLSTTTNQTRSASASGSRAAAATSRRVGCPASASSGRRACGTARGCLGSPRRARWATRCTSGPTARA